MNILNKKRAAVSLVRLSPLLVLYVAVIVRFAPAGFEADEGRYLSLAANLWQGHYAAPGSEQLPSGPGYPLVLLPLVALHLSPTIDRLLNAVLLFLAVFYAYLTLSLYIREKRALLGAYLLGLYPPIFRLLPLIMTESLVVFLVCGLTYHFAAAADPPPAAGPARPYATRTGRQGRGQAIAAGAFLGFLALTKVFFGYVLTICLTLSAIMYLWKRLILVRRSLGVCGLALLVCVPYLIYTRTLTGKAFYWSTIGGASLYWMASPYRGELGDWQGNSLEDLVRIAQQEQAPTLLTNHATFFRELSAMNDVDADSRLQEEGLHNIRHHPGKFIQNWIANWGRLLFGFPYSFTLQKISTFFYLVPNMILLGLGLLCAWATLADWRRIPLEVLALLLFAILALLGSSLLSAYGRQFTPLVPIFVIWIAVTQDRAARIEVRP